MLSIGLGIIIFGGVLYVLGAEGQAAKLRRENRQLRLSLQDRDSKLITISNEMLAIEAPELLPEPELEMGDGGV